MPLTQMMRLYWDRIAAGVFALVGVGLLIGGWVGVSGTGYVAEQIPYMVTGGIGGILAMIVAATMWVSADLRDEWQQLDSLERSVASPGGISPDDTDGERFALNGASSADTTEVLSEGPRSNRPRPAKSSAGRQKEFRAEANDASARSVPQSAAETARRRKPAQRPATAASRSRSGHVR